MLSVLALFSLSVAAAAPPAEAVAEALTAGGWSVGGEVVAADAGPWIALAGALQVLNLNPVMTGLRVLM